MVGVINNNNILDAYIAIYNIVLYFYISNLSHFSLIELHNDLVGRY